GEEALRVQIARRAVESGCQIHLDDIVITTGCQEALTLALRATTQPGDIVAIESPAFFGTLQLIESLGLKALEIPTDTQTGLSPDA
ncbi:GntR family transcriptional regulator, partial [Escherichia coli]|nr:GntR family transcriptional regulator [Escherichia coli]